MNYEEFIDSLDGDCVVDFWAEWCPPCKAFSPIFNKVSEDSTFKDIAFIKINVDDNNELCQELGIMSIPTLQFYTNGTMLDETNNASNEQDFVDFIKNNI